MRAAEAGFTLLELLVVLAILSLLVGVSLPYLRFGGVDSAAFAQDLSAQLALARARALSARRPVSLSIDVTAGRFGIDGARDRALPAGLALDWSLPSGQISGRTGSIIFFPDGGATGGSVTVTGRGRDALVSVDWLTGAIRHVP